MSQKYILVSDPATYSLKGIFKSLLRSTLRLRDFYLQKINFSEKLHFLFIWNMIKLFKKKKFIYSMKVVQWGATKQDY